MGIRIGSFKPNNKMTRTEFSRFIARGLNEDYRVDNGLVSIDELKPIAEAVANATRLNVRSAPSQARKTTSLAA